MFPIKSSDAYIKDNGKRSTIGAEFGDVNVIPEFSISDAGKVLTVNEDGELEWDTAGGGAVILTGTSDPLNTEGDNGNIYLKTQIGAYINCNPDFRVNNTTQRLSSQSTDFYKTYDDPCIAVHYKNGEYYGPLLISPVERAVFYTRNSTSFGNVTINGTTWYVGTTEYWSKATDNPTIPIMHDDTLLLTIENLSAIVTRILQAASFVNYYPNDNIIISPMLKVNNVWQPLIGSLYNDVGV